MKYSVQEQIWCEYIDAYVLWSKNFTMSDVRTSTQLPGLRLLKWNGFSTIPGEYVTLFLTGHYSERYSYNSVFPYTIDNSYSDWQIRFLDSIDSSIIPSVRVRDYHKSASKDSGDISRWISSNGINYDDSQSFDMALINSKITVHTVPQTTVLESLISDRPSIFYWNPDANFIREDLLIFYEILEDVGVFHQSPESAALQLNKIFDAPLIWWNSIEVRHALDEFRKNVCYSTGDTIESWSDFIKNV